MPLMHGKSDRAFKENVRTEMHEGKPLKQSLAIAYAMKRRSKKMAEGGQVEDNYQPAGNPHIDGDGVDEKASGFVSHPGNDVKPGCEEYEFNQMGEEDEGEGDMNGVDPFVRKIMMGRMKGYSEGGKVANEDEIEAGFMPNEFDDLTLRDDLSSSYGDDDNSGDALGNEREDHDRADIIARIMASRRKKDRMPNPA